MEDADGNKITEAKRGDNIRVYLKAALNVDPEKEDRGWLEVTLPDGIVQKIDVIETGVNTGVFTAEFNVPNKSKKGNAIFSYGYFGFEKTTVVCIK